MTARSAERTQFLTDVLTTAVEGGINYWATVVKYDAGASGSVTLFETEEDGSDNITVTIDDIARALGRFMRGADGARFIEACGPGALKLANRTNGEDGDYDAGDADALLQIAAFGETVYG